MLIMPCGSSWGSPCRDRLLHAHVSRSGVEGVPKGSGVGENVDPVSSQRRRKIRGSRAATGPSCPVACHRFSRSQGVQPLQRTGSKVCLHRMCSRRTLVRMLSGKLGKQVARAEPVFSPVQQVLHKRRPVPPITIAQGHVRI